MVDFSIKNMSVSYDNNEALSDVSIEISAGCINVLVGKNGSGKTTLFKAISGHLNFSGQILLDNHEIDSSDILWIPQDLKEITPNSLKVKEIILLSKVNYYPLLKKNDEKYHSDLTSNLFQNKLLSELSGGQRQWIIGLIALSLKKRILLLDEIFKPLDEGMIGVFWEILSDYVQKNNIICIIITHDIQFILERVKSGKIIILQDGKVVESKNAINISKNELLKYLI